MTCGLEDLAFVLEACVAYCQYGYQVHYSEAAASSFWSLMVWKPLVFCLWVSPVQWLSSRRHRTHLQQRVSKKTPQSKTPIFSLNLWQLPWYTYHSLTFCRICTFKTHDHGNLLKCFGSADDSFCNHVTPYNA